jgi:uncharacterized protein (TIGR03067 family)
LAKRLAQRGLVVSGVSLAAVLSQKEAAAGVASSVLASTVKAATAVAAGETTTGLVSAKVAALTEGVVKAMLVNRLKNLVAVLLVLGTISGGGWLLAQATAPGQDRQEEKPFAERAAGGTAAPEKDRKVAQRPRTDWEKLQGTWQVVSGEQNGVKLPESDLKAVVSQLVFTHRPAYPGDTVTWRRNSGTWPDMELRINPSKTPKEINFERTRKGIYEIDGDTLRLCINWPWRGAGDGSRPVRMEGKGRTHLLITFRRDKEPPRPEGKGPEKSTSAPGKEGKPVIEVYPVGDLFVQGVGRKPPRR